MRGVSGDKGLAGPYEIKHFSGQARKWCCWCYGASAAGSEEAESKMLKINKHRMRVNSYLNINNSIIHMRISLALQVMKTVMCTCMCD